MIRIVPFIEGAEVAFIRARLLRAALDAMSPEGRFRLRDDLMKAAKGEGGFPVHGVVVEVPRAVFSATEARVNSKALRLEFAAIEVSTVLAGMPLDQFEAPAEPALGAEDEADA
jgi:hypothetical protein